MANQFEQFTPDGLGASADNLGSVRAQPYSFEAMAAMSPNTATSFLPDVSFGKAVAPDAGQVADIRNAPPQDQPQDDEIPAPTPEQTQAMHAQAAEGSLNNDTARASVVRAFQAGGTRGLRAEFRDSMNSELARVKSDYRARIVRADGPNGVINLYMILQNQRANPAENLPNMIRDLNMNGANSPYGNRAVHMQLTPQPRPADV